MVWKYTLNQGGYEVQRVGGKHIATYLLTAEDLPIYLWQWPMLRSDRDALQWAQDTQGETVSGMNRRWRMRDRSEKLSYAR